jgi:N-methylhydantoinase A
MAWRVGIDSGGTFTDVCLFDDETGAVAVWKVSSTPDDPSSGIAAGLAEGLAQVGASAEQVSYFGHGTTVATNALIQNRGARTGLITTDGFRDLLEIGRQKRPDLYDMTVDKPVPLVTRDLRLEVRERIRHDGSIETTLDEQGFRAAVRRLRDAGVRSIAVCFLYGFLNTTHEDIAAAILREECPDTFISISNQIAPEFREFERLSTTVMNASLGPVMRGYIERLSQRLADQGVRPTPHLTQSNGGVISFEQAARLPVRTVLSGPSTGVVGAREIGRLAGYEDLITFDMGGTSTDVALLTGGECRLSGEATVHGYPIKAPMLDIHTVGAGGGSIAFVDNGLLKVGPRSAGAHPGPVCYGFGNQEPTVTDANMVLGLLNPTHLLGGRMAVDRALALSAITRLGAELKLDPLATARGILAVVTANMVRAIRVISVRRGYDPRDYTLMAFGGAGPLHAARLAGELDIRRVLIPRNPGILCAMGLLLTDLRSDHALTRPRTLDAAAEGPMTEAFQILTDRARRWFDDEAIDHANRRVVRTVDMRYTGQNYELAVPLPDGDITPASLDALRAGFIAIHQRLYGFAPEDEPMQLVTFRVEATGLVPKASFAPDPVTGSNGAAALIGMRDMHNPDGEGSARCPVYDRDRLRAGDRFDGPAIIEQMDATCFVPAGMTARVDPWLNLVLEAA